MQAQMRIWFPEPMTTTRPLTYLACPYSHPDREVRVERFEAANVASAHLMALGKVVFSPISHTHPIAEVADLPKGWDYWKEFDLAYLSCSCEVYVLKLGGWEESKGVTAEIATAEKMKIPVHYLEDLDPSDPGRKFERKGAG